MALHAVRSLDRFEVRIEGNAVAVRLQGSVTIPAVDASAECDVPGVIEAGVPSERRQRPRAPAQGTLGLRFLEAMAASTSARGIFFREQSE